ncbi:MAG: hypothetical protein AAB408_01205 [Patescibacteria group bacterium]
MARTLSLKRIFFWPLILFLLNEFLSRATTVLDQFPWIDNPMHFLGGFLIVQSLDEIFQYLRWKGYYGKVHPLLYIAIMTAFVGTIAIAWEWHEFLRDTFFGEHTQPSQADTMLDLFLGIVGGLLGAFLLQIKNQRSTHRKTLR